MKATPIGLVQPSHTFIQVWLDEAGRPEASLGVRIATVNPVHPALAFLIPASGPVPEHLQAVLRYRAGGVGEAPRDIEDSIWLDERRCGVKGYRLRFIWPGCSRRVAALYLDGVHFQCRKCCGLGYRSQRKTREARGLEKAARIKQQLGGSGDYADPVPERPKGMHHRTYERLCNEGRKRYFPIKTGS